MAEPEPPYKAEMPVQVFQTLDRRDENQILAEMRGEIIEDLVYDTNTQGRRVTNLSYAGVKEAIRVRDLQNRIDVLGASTAEKQKPFAYTLAVNKAERNAFAKLIPAKWLATLIDDYLNKKARPASTPTAEAPASADPAPAEAAISLQVPVTKDSIQMDGLRQFPLTDGLKAVGMFNVIEGQAAIVPERPLKADGPTIAGFLVPRVLDL